MHEHVTWSRRAAGTYCDAISTELTVESRRFAGEYSLMADLNSELRFRQWG